MRTLALCLAVLSGLALAPANAQTVVIDFDDLPGQPPPFTSGAPVLPQYLITTRYQPLGVVFNSTGGGIFVAAAGNPVSPPNSVGATSAGPAISYSDPIEAIFDFGGGPQVVDSVSIALTSSSSISTLEAYDLSGSLLGSNNGTGGGTILVSFPGQIHRVRILQGPMAFDDFTFTNISGQGGPTSYCTAGTTSSGCHATMGSSGTASLSNTAPFTLTCTNVEGNKNGIFFYGITGRAASTWGIGGTSWLCVKAPTQRMAPLLASGGSAGTCTGSFAADWNAYVAANPLKPINQALTVGSLVDAQAWFRDPASGTGPVGAKGTALSDGLEFPVGP